MEDLRDISPENVPAELNTSWHIPRPTLARSSKNSNDSSPSSTNSTQSARSGSLLLTAATIAQIHRQMDSSPSTRQKNLQYYLRQVDSRSELLPSGGIKKPPPDPDSLSLASSTHFTVINVNSRPGSNRRSVCRRHQNTILVLTMCTLITIGILAAIFFLEMRAKSRQH